jgi:hypothetical protein
LSLAGVRMLLVASALSPFLVAAAMGPAQAKGEYDLGFDALGYTPGQTVNATISTVASKHASMPSNDEFLREYLGHPPDGQYRVSFRRSNPQAESGMTDVVWVPAAVAFTRRETSLSARLVFQVPSVPSGRYGVRACWTPCGGQSLVGLAELSVGATELEAVLLSRLAKVQSRAGALRTKVETISTRWERSRTALDAARNQLVRATVQIESLESRIWVLEQRASARRRQSLEDLSSHDTNPALMPAAIAVGGLGGAAAASLVRRARGTRRGASR